MLSRGSVFVMFRRSLDEAAMNVALKQVPGFRRIVHVFFLTPSALVEVIPDQYEEFLKQAPDSPLVAYCSVNGPVGLASFNDSLHSSTPCRQISTDSVFMAHNVRNTSFLPGFGIQIGIIDSGIAPHPYLPATSFTTSAVNQLAWSQSLSRLNCVNQRVADLGAFEAQLGIFDPRCPAQAEDTYLASCQNRLDKLAEEIWDEISGGNRSLRKKVQLCDPVSLPFGRGLFGACRKISPHSVNLLGPRPSLDIEDRIGHGTQLAGLIAAAPPLSFVSQNNVDPATYKYLKNNNVGMYGLAPYAELVVIKCYDDLIQGDLGTLARGIEYAVKSGCDVVLCALTLAVKDIQSYGGLGALRHLEATVNAARTNDVCLISAAGNEGWSSGCLTVPAAFNSTVAIGGASIGLGGGNLQMSPLCNLPGQNEKLDFFATGDLADLGVITTSRDFGFQCVRGSSVSAAIAASLFTRAMSYAYLAQLDASLCGYLNLQTGVQPIIKRMGHIPQRRPTWSSVLYRADQAAVPVWGPKNSQGRFLQDFTL